MKISAAFCDGDPKHQGRLYNLTLWAREIGASHRTRDLLHIALGHYCENCLAQWGARLKKGDWQRARLRHREGNAT